MCVVEITFAPPTTLPLTVPLTLTLTYCLSHSSWSWGQYVIQAFTMYLRTYLCIVGACTHSLDHFPTSACLHICLTFLLVLAYIFA